MKQTLYKVLRSKHALRLLAIFGVGMLLFFALLLITDRRPNSDDIAFQSEIAPYSNLFDWISHRYQTWSGRIVPDSFIYVFSQAPIILWKITSLLFYALFTAMLFFYYLLFTRKRTHTKDYVMLTGAILLPFLIDSSAYIDGALWVTGSMNYFWITAIGLVAFFPIAYVVTLKKIPHWSIGAAGIIAGIIAAVSQEQLGLVLATLTIILSGYYCIHTRKNFSSRHTIYLLVFSVIITCSVLVNIFAPGNELRIQAETLTRLPTFNSVPILDKVDFSLRWFLDRLINHASFFMSIISAALAMLFVSKNNKSKLDYIYTSILAIGSFFVFMKGSEIINYWFNFHPTWQHEALPAASYFMLVPWVVTIFVIATAPIVLAKKPYYIFVSMIIFAAFASLAVVTFSPTMYDSGLRVAYVPSILLFVALFLLIDRLFEIRKKLVLVSLIFVFILFASQYLQVVLRTLY